MSFILALALFSGQVGMPMLGGVATYYDYHQGQAAAGPALRDALGPDWRGQTVTVCGTNGACVRVKLTDWCACGDRNGRDTLIDLDVRDFGKLALPSMGVIDVTVEWGGPAVTPPATSTEPYWSFPRGGPR